MHFGSITRRGALRLFGSTLILLATLCARPLAAQEQPAAEDTATRKKVHIEAADYIRSFTYEGRIIERLIGNVRLMHNNAVMTCDSAYRYSDSEFTGYGRVVITKDDTRLYGDEVNYDGHYSLAQVRGHIVRLVDKASVLRTQFLDFDTNENIGHFFDGGTIKDEQSLIESSEGYYYSRQKLFVFKDSVEMRDDTYLIRSDSGRYNTRTRMADFHTGTHVWHSDGFLACDNGWYDQSRDHFHFSRNSYLLADEREMWADTLSYRRRDSLADAYGHIQVHDTLQSLYAFGHEAHLSQGPDRVMLTRDPSVAYYTLEDNLPDTIFLRGDTLRLFSDPNPAYYGNDSVPPPDSAALPLSDTLQPLSDTLHTLPDSLHTATDTTLHTLPDTLLLPPADTISPPLSDTLQPLSDTLQPLLDTLYTLPDSLHTATDTALHTLPDTLLLPPADTISPPLPDTLHPLSDTLALPPADTMQPLPDSVIRQFFAYPRVRIYRSNVQGICDSLAYSSLDSLARLFGEPVLWNEQQQITSDEMRFLAGGQTILRADFLTNAFALSLAHEQDTFYNQLRGRDIIGHFRDNDVYRVDVHGGAQTIFYMLTDSVVTNVDLGGAPNMRLDIRDRKIRRTVYLGNTEEATHPATELPADQAHLKGFRLREAERPQTRHDVCTARIRATRRPWAAQLPRPMFPITGRIDKL